MTRDFAIQMDPIETINIAGDSSFAIMLAAQARGHRLWHYEPGDLSYRDGRVVARARSRVSRPGSTTRRQWYSRLSTSPGVLPGTVRAH